MSSKYVPRVNQLDAIQLDEEIYKIFQEQVSNILKNLPPGILSQYQPELELIIKSAIFYFSIATTGSSFGMQLLSISYTKHLTKNKLFLQYILTIVSKYVKDCSSIRFTGNLTFQNAIRLLDCFSRILFLFNFFRFLKVGKKPGVVDYILGLNFVSLTGNRMRNIGYTYMTRELIWSGFMELLGVTLPLINYHAVKRKFRNILKLSSNAQLQATFVDFTSETKCAFCSERPVLPHYMGCSHVFCYYCLQANKLADSNFQCNLCDWNGDQIEKVTVRIYD